MRMDVSWGRVGFGVAGVLLLSLVAAVHVAYFTPVLRGVDPNGYHMGGRCIAETGWPGRPMSDPYRFLGRMWVVTPRGEAFPKYPPFYPAVIAGARHVGGATLAYGINPVASLLAVAGAVALGALMGLGGWSLVVGLLVWLCPVLIQHGHHQTSHATSMALLAWGMVAGLGGARGLPRRGALSACVLGGVLIGGAAGVRYTNVLLVLPLLVGVVGCARGRRERVVAFFTTSLGVSLPWLTLGVFHWIAYGAPWVTGYAMTSEQGGFSMAAAIRNLPLYSVGYVDSLLGPALALSFVGVGFLVYDGRRYIPLFLAWVLPLPLLYLFYYWAPARGSVSYMRFVLPVLFPLALVAAYGLRRLAALWGRAGAWVAAGLLLLVQLPWALAGALPAWENSYRSSCVQRQEVDAVLRGVPAGSVLIASSGLLNAIEVEGDYLLYPDEIFSQPVLQRLGMSRNGEDPHGLQFDRVVQLQALLGDVPPNVFRERTASLIEGHLAAGREVYFVGKGARMQPARYAFGRAFETELAFSTTNQIPDRVFFEPRTGSRASDAPLQTSTEFCVRGWRLTARRTGPEAAQDRLEALRERQRELLSGRTKQERELAGEYHRLLRDIERLDRQARQRREARAK